MLNLGIYISYFMKDKQTNRVNSLIKSSDFLSDHAADLVVIAQLPPLAAQLATLIQDIETAAGKGKLDLTGVAEHKSIVKQKLLDQMLKVARGAAAYYLSTDNKPKLRIVDLKPSELKRKRDNDLFAIAKELHQMAVADGAFYIYITPADIANLDTLKEDFFDIIQNPKRELEIAAQYNALINPLIAQGYKLREHIDIYMRTFIAGNALLYNEWEASMSIDDTGAKKPTAYTLTLTVPANTIQTIDYSSVALQGNTAIKLINKSGAELVYGFGPNSNSFAGTHTVYANTQKRKSASSLGYNALSATNLNVQNIQPIDLECTIEMYDMG